MEFFFVFFLMQIKGIGVELNFNALLNFDKDKWLHLVVKHV